MFQEFSKLIAEGDLVAIWLAAFLVIGLIAGITTGFFKARKIQPRGFKWKIFRNEAIFSTVTFVVSATVLGYITTTLRTHGIIEVNPAPANWWVIAFEYVLYFIGFDTWFYWLHRWMHKEPVYSKVHKLHHLSTSPNLLTTFSVNPLESLINGGFVTLFMSVLTVHQETAALILPTNIIMGLYVHSGYEFFPRWWNKSWMTKWFITATFHDQHHRYFTCNYGGYTTIWDRICGTMRPKFESDFEKLKDRVKSSQAPAPAPATAMAEASPEAVA